MIRMERDFTASRGDAVKAHLAGPRRQCDPARHTRRESVATLLRAQFDPLTIQEEEALTMVLYSRADTWLGWGETREADKPLSSLGRIVKLSFSASTRPCKS